MGDLVFGPETALPPAQPKPLQRVVGVLDRHLPGLLSVPGVPVGVHTASIHFVSGAMEGVTTATPQYLHARSTGEPPTVATADTVSIVSGICLFGAGGLDCLGPAGEPTILERPGVSAPAGLPLVAHVERGATQLYVPESVARLGRTIVAVAQLAEQNGKPASVCIHLPGPEYKLQAEVAYWAGRVTLGALQQYYELVDEAVTDAKTQFGAICKQFAVPEPTFGSPLDSVMNGIEPGSLTPDSFKDSPFEALAGTAAGMQHIEHASEVAAYLQAARDGALAVFVDNHAQEKIFKAAKQTLGFRGVALYPLPLCVSQQSGNLLYHTGATTAEIVQATAPWLEEK